MCRMVCYIGPPVTLAELILSPVNGLAHQAYAPRYQTHGTMNADGFGVGWYDHGRSDLPARYRRALPIWNDRTFESIAPLIASGTVLAAVRSATPPLAVHEANTPPYGAGPWLFAHNGAVDGFAGPAGERLRRLIPAARASALEGSTDSEALFALMLAAIDAGREAGEAMRDAIVTAESVTGGGRMTMCATDGRSAVAVTWGDTLFVRETAGAVTIASEPFDDDAAWQRVPDRTLVRATPGSVVTVPAAAASAGPSAGSEKERSV